MSSPAIAVSKPGDLLLQVLAARQLVARLDARLKEAAALRDLGACDEIGRKLTAARTLLDTLATVDTE